MEQVDTQHVAPVWIRGPQLRARWGGMSNTAFYEKLKRGAIPKPHHPFGDAVPYWSMADIVAFERQATSQAA